MEIFEPSFAKLNLCLDVTGLLPGGYHSIRSIMQSTDFHDDVRITPGGGEWSAKSNLKFLPSGRTNLAVRAAELFAAETGLCTEGGIIRLTKRIPVCGGFGGGSGNAAAVLRALNRACGAGLSGAQLCRMAEKLGSDVPFCVLGGTMLAEGRGERLTSLPSLPKCEIVICRPPFSSSTPELFAALDRYRPKMHPDVDGMISALESGSLSGVARRMFNIFEAVLPKRQAAMVEETRGELLDSGALGACMTGTGSGVFAIFPDEATARTAAAKLRRTGVNCYVCRST